MKKLYLILLLLCWGSLAVLNAQMGSTINYQDNYGSETLEFSGQIDGRNRYSSQNMSPDGVYVDWVNERWEIITDITTLFFSNVDVGLNPPDLATGQWQAVFAGDQLITFEGSGTQEVLMGDECPTAIQIDSLFGGAVAEARATQPFNISQYNDTDSSDPNVTCEGPTLFDFRTVWFSFVGDGLDYEITLDTVGLEDPSDLPLLILFNGDCDDLTSQYCAYTTSDFYRIPSFSTVIGTEYKILVGDGSSTVNSNARVQVTRQGAVNTTEISQTEIEVYPNPTTGLVNLSGTRAEEIAVVDFSGRVVQRRQNPGNQIDISGLPTGVYTLLITERGRRYFSRIVKE